MRFPHLVYALRVLKHVTFPKSETIDGCRLPGGHWEASSGLLQEQQESMGTYSDMTMERDYSAEGNEQKQKQSTRLITRGNPIHAFIPKIHLCTCL